MATLVRIKKWGKRLAVVIPDGFAKSRRIEVSAVIDLASVCVCEARRRRYKLSELLAKYKPRHRQGEWNLGYPIGREVW